MPITTRAAIAFAPNTPLQMHEVTLADPGPGEVMVKLLASGLCHSDLHILDGAIPQRFPLVLGHEAIGEVLALGDGVTDFAVGDRVIPFIVPDCGVCAFCRSGRTNYCVQWDLRRETRRRGGHAPFSLQGEPVGAFLGLGTFAETTVVAADMLTRVNPAARADHACCIGCGVTTGLGAALIAARVHQGASVAVFGLGGVGLSVIQGARIAGAARIIGVDTNPAKAEVAHHLGATDFIDPAKVENVVAAIRQMTGLGVDFAFECVGVPAIAAQALDCTNPAWGLATNLGIMPAGATLQTAPTTLSAGRRWTGSLMGGAKRHDVARFVDMYVAGAYRLDELVSHRLAHDEINRGFDMMRNGTSIRSVVVYR